MGSHSEKILSGCGRRSGWGTGGWKRFQNKNRYGRACGRCSPEGFRPQWLPFIHFSLLSSLSPDPATKWPVLPGGNLWTAIASSSGSKMQVGGFPVAFYQNSIFLMFWQGEASCYGGGCCLRSTACQWRGVSKKHMVAEAVILAFHMESHLSSVTDCQL